MREMKIISSSPQQQSRDQFGLEQEGDGGASSNRSCPRFSWNSSLNSSRFSWKAFWRNLRRRNIVWEKTRGGLIGLDGAPLGFGVADNTS